jgi:uncharacterized protein (TIGR01244 family)
MFSLFKPRAAKMNIRKIDDQFSVAGQIAPAEVKAVADAGYHAILCARPDHEEAGQPTFSEVARAAEAAGLQIVHIPVSGGLSEGDIIRFQEAWDAMPKPMLGYCRSGARAGSLYQTLTR